MTSIDANPPVESQFSQQMPTDNVNGGYRDLKWLIVITIIFSFHISSIELVFEFEILPELIRARPVIWAQNLVSFLLVSSGVLVSISLFINASKFIKVITIWAFVAFVFQIWHFIYVSGLGLDDQYYLLFWNAWLPFLLCGFFLYLSLKTYKAHQNENNKNSDTNLIIESQNYQQTIANNVIGGYTDLKWIIVITILFSFDIYSIQLAIESEMLSELINSAPELWAQRLVSFLLLVTGVLVNIAFFVNASKFIKTVIIWAFSGFVFQVWRLIYLAGFTQLDGQYDPLFWPGWFPLLICGFLLYLSLKTYKAHQEGNITRSNKKLTS